MKSAGIRIPKTHNRMARLGPRSEPFCFLHFPPFSSPEEEQSLIWGKPPIQPNIKGTYPLGVPQLHRGISFHIEMEGMLTRFNLVPRL